MSRQIIQLHTLQQWLAVDPTIRSVILQHIKLKDRLQRWLLEHAQRPPLPPEGKWVPCNKCDQKGWVHKSPRHPGLHPSQLSKPCLLQLYWQMEGHDEEERANPRMLLIFDIGTAIHHMLQGYGKAGAWGPHYTPEARMTEGSHPFATELMIEGSADAENILIIEDIPNAPIYEVGVVHEYKTIKSENFAKLTRPKPEHKQQGTLYCGVLNRPVTAFLYISKNDSNMADFPVEFDQGLWSMLEGKARVLIDHYERQAPPPANVGYHCKECGFARICEAFQATQKAPRVALRR